MSHSTVTIEFGNPESTLFGIVYNSTDHVGNRLYYSSNEAWGWDDDGNKVDFSKPKAEYDGKCICGKQEHAILVYEYGYRVGIMACRYCCAITGGINDGPCDV